MTKNWCRSFVPKDAFIFLLNTNTMNKWGLQSKATCNDDFRLSRKEYLLPADCTKGTLVLMTRVLEIVFNCEWKSNQHRWSSLWCSSCVWDVFERPRARGGRWIDLDYPIGTWWWWLLWMMVMMMMDDDAANDERNLCWCSSWLICRLQLRN